MTSHHLEIVDGGLDQLYVPFRYAFLKFDLMANFAGMRDANAGAAGIASRSPARAASTYSSGRDRT